MKKISKHGNLVKIRALLNDPSIHTVCEEAHCPNLGECFEKHSLAFMILGDVCTRNCSFCAVAGGIPQTVDPDEPKKVLDAVKKLGLKYVVVTSATRDDLPDGGAAHYAKVIENLRLNVAVSKIEVLIPDFCGDEAALKTVLDAKPFVLNHNVETISRLYPKVRPQADYIRSLKLLEMAKKLSPSIYTKSGFMVGLGEADEEIISLLRDLRSVFCDIVTIGQYLPPSSKHFPVSRFVEPETFEWYSRIGRELGFEKVFSGPFVRSSYKAEEILCSPNNQKGY